MELLKIFLWATVLFIVTFLFILLIGDMAGEVSCNIKYASYTHTYKGVFGGCMIKENKRWIPVGNYVFSKIILNK